MRPGAAMNACLQHKGKFKLGSTPIGNSFRAAPERIDGAATLDQRRRAGEAEERVPRERDQVDGREDDEAGGRERDERGDPGKDGDGEARSIYLRGEGRRKRKDGAQQERADQDDERDR